VDLVLATPATATNTHPGVDFVELDKNGSPQCGGPIYPLADGEVVDLISDSNDPDFGVPGVKGFGYMVMLRHSSVGAGIPFYTLYLHMEAPPASLCVTSPSR
jgi:murein DD-endopeptidase MepM/ murein hydrolase activator NlpD